MRHLVTLLLVALLTTLQGCIPLVISGVSAGVMMAQDRRTAGTIIDDESIELKLLTDITAKYKESTSGSHINVTSYNRHVLITGEVPSEAIKSDVAKIVAKAHNVKAISNELVISGPSSMTTRSSDSLITGDVKLRFIHNQAFQSDHVKVITENGVVYLLGLLYHKEADAASEVASTTSGVQRVVRVFEYLD